MTPEQIQGTLQIENQTENIRRQAVGDIIQGTATASEMARRDVQNRLALAQEARSQTMLPLDVQKAQAAIEVDKANVARSKALLEQMKTMNPLEQQKLLADVAYSQARTKQFVDMAPLERDQAIANLQQTRTQTGEIGAGRRQAQTQYEETHVDMSIPDPDAPGGRRIVKIPGTNVLAAKQQGAVEAHRQATEAQATARQQRAEAKDIRTEREKAASDARDAETTILANPSKEQVAPLIDTFNEKSTKDYMYYQKPGTIYGQSATKIPLKDQQGKPIPAWQVARRAAALGMQPLEYVRQVMYGGKLPGE